MAKEFRFPDVGEGIHEGKIVKWHIQQGDMVKADEILLDMETDKAVVEMPSPASGMILSMNFKEGDTVKVGDVLVTIGEAREMISSAGDIESAGYEEKKTGIGKQGGNVLKANIKTQPSMTSPFIGPGSGTNLPPLATPSTRALARELGIDLVAVRGTGPAGRITEADIRDAKEMMRMPQPLRPAAAVAKETMLENASEKKAFEKNAPERNASDKTPAIPTPLIEGDVSIPLTGIRKTIAERMTFSKTHIPHACGMDLVDVTELVALREKEKGKMASEGIKLTYLPFIIKAAVVALRKFPSFNAHFDESANTLIAKRAINIGLAVDTPDGLMVVVVKDADKKPMSAIAKEIEILAQEAREKKVKLDDIRGSTFTVTNVGSVGGMFSTPIINPPEVAIMGVHRIRDMPWVVDGKIAVRKLMGVSLCFDHRVVDGAIATEFMNVIKEHLEDPSLMLVDMI